MAKLINKDINYNLDSSNMQDAIASFPRQIDESFKIMEDWSPRNEYLEIQKVMILGMGGSAIGGDIAKVIVQNKCSVPIIINRSYSIPEWVDDKTLVIASSYSGNTAETLSSFKLCKEKKSSIIILSTGGILGDYAMEMNLDLIIIPKGFQPRAAIGFSFTLIILILRYFGFISDIIINNIKNSIIPVEKLSLNISQSNNLALEVATKIHNTCPIIYGSENLGWVIALRFRGQLAENSKMLSFHHHFPEQNHNEIEGWTKNENIMSQFSIIWIKDEEDHVETKLRMKITSSLLESVSGKQIIISQSGENRIERLLKLIHFIDWVSYFAALLNNVDPTPVNRIQELKNKITKIV